MVVRGEGGEEVPLNVERLVSESEDGVVVDADVDVGFV